MNQPIDRIFKHVGAEDPKGLRRLAGAADLPGEIVTLASVKLTPNLEMDGVLLVESPAGKWIEHYEFKSQYRSDSKRQRLKYAFGLYLSPNSRAIRSTLIVVLPGAFPKSYHELPPYEVPGVVSLLFNTVRVWERDAALAMNWPNSSLLPLVPFMRSTREQELEAARRLEGHESGLILFEAALHVKYDEEEIAGFWEELEMTIAERIVMEAVPASKWGKEMIKRESLKLVQAEVKVARVKARQEGLQKGMREGLLKGVREGLLKGRLESALQVLAARFPGISAPDLSAITDSVTAGELLVEIARAETAAEVRKVLKRFTSAN